MSPRKSFVSNKKVATPSLFVVRFCRGTSDVLSVSHKRTSLSGIGVLLKLTTLTCLKVKKRVISENGNGFCCFQINLAMHPFCISTLKDKIKDNIKAKDDDEQAKYINRLTSFRATGVNWLSKFKKVFFKDTISSRHSSRNKGDEM